MTVPRGWPLAATGRERERTDNPDGTTTHRYYQEDVHDFAWTTSPDFSRRASASSIPDCPRWTCGCCCQPEHASQAARHFESARATLRYYGEWFGAYPYGHITIVDPPWESGHRRHGVSDALHRRHAWLMPREDTYLEDTVVHEAGHQWWYGMVATNEFEDAWMDEGINQYANARVDGRRFSRRPRSAALLRRVRAVGARRRAVGPPDVGRVPDATTAAARPSTYRRRRRSDTGRGRPAR